MPASNHLPKKTNTARKVLFITRAYGTAAGGMERLSFELISCIASTPEFSVKVLAHSGPRWASPLFSIFIIPRALWAARGAAAVHLGDPLLSLVGWLMHRLYRIPVAVHVHGLDVLYPSALYQLYLKVFFRSFTTYFAISPAVAEILRQFGVAGQVEVLTPAVHDRQYQPGRTRAELSKLLTIDAANARVLLTVGRLVERKGHAWFIREVLPQLPANTQYVIAGSGPARDEIISAITAAELQQRVHLLNRVTDEQLQVLYNTVDAFVQPNIPVAGDLEGFGLVLVEAALCARPVFAANFEGIPAASHDGKNGRLLPAKNAKAWTAALQEFLRIPGAHQPTGTAAREYTKQHFTWETQGSRYRKAFSALIASRLT